jgi:class 3 adenylate cyclase
MNTIDKPNIQKKELTVVFWDISGFSHLCDILRGSSIPESLIEFINEYYAAVDKVLSNHEGTLDKYMGDGVMALFKTDNHAYSAVEASKALRDSFTHLIKSYMKKWTSEGHINETIDIGLKTGINTGQAIMAEVGTDQKRQYTAFGSVVNYASRFAGLANKGDIIISPSTNSKVEENYFPPPAKIPVEKLYRPKSFGDVKECYKLQGTNPFPTAVRKIGEQE